MPLSQFLIMKALESQRLRFEETESHYLLHARFCGMEIVVSSISKAEIAEGEKAQRRANLRVVS